MTGEALTTDERVATGCEWKQDEETNWQTGCGNAFVFIDSGPIENGMKFCCYCGLSLDELPYDDADEEAHQMELDALSEEDEIWSAEHPDAGAPAEAKS